ncbi:MAG: hypothetical protein IJ619_12225 [Eubacterium sp.]|nr:hypothetical protein [Eubacterium sp.]
MNTNSRKTIIILVISASVIAIITGIILFIMKNHYDVNGPHDENDFAEKTISDAESVAEGDIKEDDSSKISTADLVAEVYEPILQAYKKEKDTAKDDDYKGSYYKLYDVNDDGVDELFLAYRLEGWWTGIFCDRLYTIVNDEAVEISFDNYLDKSVHDIDTSLIKGKLCVMTLAEVGSDVGDRNYYLFLLMKNSHR